MTLEGPRERPVAVRPEPTWDLILKRNNVERLKRERFPFEIAKDFDGYAADDYLALPEEDVVRLQWYGLYHDKPKVGSFMLRIKLPGGQLSPGQLSAIARTAREHGTGEYLELSTRQNVQLHGVRMKSFRQVFDGLAEAGLTTLGGCGDTVRNITACPVAGIAADELFDVTPTLREAAGFFYGHPVYSDLPRKHKITVSGCPHHCNAPEMHCIALIAVIQGGRQGYAIRVGGGLSTVPRLSRSLGAFVPVEDTLEVLRAILDAWREDLRYRMSRVKARLKFMVDDIGPEGVRERVETRLGRRLEDIEVEPVSIGHTTHTGVHPQRQPGLNHAGFTVFGGAVTAAQLEAIAEVAAADDLGIRLTRFQNFILTGIPDDRVDHVVGAIEGLGFPSQASELRSASLGCTGSPLCNYAVSETKSTMRSLVGRLEARFGDAARDIKVNVDGCPHSCAHHWTGDIGLQGTTSRERAADGSKVSAYDIYLRGGYGAEAQIGRPLVRRIKAGDVGDVVERLVDHYLSHREAAEAFTSYVRRLPDHEILAAAGVAAPSGPEPEEEAE